MQCVHAGSFPSHLIFFFLHMSQAWGQGVSPIAWVVTMRDVVATANGTHPCDPPPLCLVCIVEQAIGVSEHLSCELWRQVLHWQAVIAVGTKDLRGLVHERRMRHGRHLEATHMVIHGDVDAQEFLIRWWIGRGCGWD